MFLFAIGFGSIIGEQGKTLGKYQDDKEKLSETGINRAVVSQQISYISTTCKYLRSKSIVSKDRKIQTAARMEKLGNLTCCSWSFR